ncbi:MAG TPA: M23 family metallopeptidase [Thermoanaerobaculia bacterium]|nr:M23 family metallopeptidase [Thermoanaerobaculia bacterium]
MNCLLQRRLGGAGLAAFLLLLLLGSLVPAPEGGAQAAGGRADAVYPMVFPVAGDHVITDSFGDLRGGGRSHTGVDIMAEKMVPVVAVADAEVGWVFAERGGNCCDVSLIHEDGWRSRYIHLNNDTPGTDDGRAVGIAPGVREGAKVIAGQVIGWVGDSGNAEATAPHLHFELRRPDGTPVDPYSSLLAAKRRGRPLVAPPRRPDGREERSPGLWDRLRGRDAAERPAEPVPDPPPPPGPGPGDTLRLVPTPEEDLPRVPLEDSEEGVPASSAGLAMEPGSSVELVVLDDDCCGDRIGPAEVAKEERAGGWLGCLGFGQRKQAPEGS